MIWIKRILPLPALNSRKWDTASSSALAGSICFYSSLNTRLFPKSQEVDRSLRFLSLSQQRSRLCTGISSALACHPKLTPAPGDSEAPLQETQRDSSVCRADGTELPQGPLVEVHRVMGPGDPFLSKARLTQQLTTLQRSRFHNVDSELYGILPQPCKGCFQILLLSFLFIVSFTTLLSIHRQQASYLLCTRTPKNVQKFSGSGFWTGRYYQASALLPADQLGWCSLSLKCIVPATSDTLQIHCALHLVESLDSLLSCRGRMQIKRLL